MPVADFPTAVRVRVPAKINLHLGVGPLRPDGYHDLTTVFQAVSHLRRGRRPAGATACTSRCPAPSRAACPPDAVESGLAGRRTARRRTPARPRRRRARDPQVDPGRGRDGGRLGRRRGDAARLRRLWRHRLASANCSTLAAQLGSDVAFPLTGGTALGTGRGEQLTPVLTTGEFHWVLALADFGISTAEAYAELDRLRAAGTRPTRSARRTSMLDALRAGDCESACRHAGQRPAAGGAVAAARARTTSSPPAPSSGALGGIVSGSGPTCAFLCADRRRPRRISQPSSTAPRVCAAPRSPPRARRTARASRG